MLEDEIGGNARHQCLEVGVVAELARVELAVQLHHAADVAGARPSQAQFAPTAHFLHRGCKFGGKEDLPMLTRFLALLAFLLAAPQLLAAEPASLIARSKKNT